MDSKKYIRKTFTVDGVRYYVKARTEEEAIRKMVEKKIAIKNGELTDGGGIPLSQWSEIAFDTYKPDVSERYLHEIKVRFAKHVLSDIGKVPVEKVTPLQLQQILNRQKGRSRSHITKLSQEMFFVFDCARKNGMIVKNPAADLVRPKGTNTKRRALTKSERNHLLLVIPKDPRFIFFELMLFCGCRPAEAAEVKFEDVTYIQRVPFLHIRGTKTENSDRYVPIPRRLQPLLLARGKHGYVATNKNGRKHNESSYKRMVESLKRELNISMGCKVYRNHLIPPFPLADDFVPYLLRHTYCTDLKKQGVDLRIAKDLMGHADIKTTANIYDHDDGETLIMAARQMGLEVPSESA